MTETLFRWIAAPATVRTCRVVIGVLFVWAGLAKIGDMRGFAEQLHNFRLLPVALEHLVAMTLPWIEVVAGLGLVSGVRSRAGAVLAGGLVAAFTLAVVAALARGLDIECGCFGTHDATRVGWVKILQNLGMLAVAAVGSIRIR